MDLIHQQLAVRDWPLQNPGEELFFGYIVALGVFPRDWCAEGMFAYVDFAYNDRYRRYRLPDDQALRRQLLEHLVTNMKMQARGEGICVKVWVTRTKQGHQVSLP